jgi:hypothetical protein
MYLDIEDARIRVSKLATSHLKLSLFAEIGEWVLSREVGFLGGGGGGGVGRAEGIGSHGWREEGGEGKGVSDAG